MNLRLRMLAGAGLTLVIGGCPAADDSGGGGTTGASTTGGQPSATSAASMTAPTTMTTGSSMGGSTASVDTGNDTGVATSTGSDSDTGTTGVMVDCVDEDIGSAIGMDVATGTNDRQGDDFDAGDCLGDGPADAGADADADADAGADVGGGADGGGVLSGDDYVVAWSAPNDGLYTIVATGKFDTVLMIREPSCRGDMLNCNDDCMGTNSAHVIQATAGQMFFFVIDGYDGDTGDFTLSIRADDMLSCDGGPAEDGPMTDSGAMGD